MCSDHIERCSFFYALKKKKHKILVHCKIVWRLHNWVKFFFFTGLNLKDIYIWYEFLSNGVASENRENKFTIDLDVCKDVFWKEYFRP